MKITLYYGTPTKIVEVVDVVELNAATLTRYSQANIINLLLEAHGMSYLDKFTTYEQADSIIYELDEKGKYVKIEKIDY